MNRQDLVPVAPTYISLAGPVIPEHLTQPGPSLPQILTILWAYRRMMIVIVVLTTIFVGLISKLLPKSYDSTAAILVDYEINDPLVGKEFPLSLMASYMATQVQLIESPVVLLKVVDRLNLTANKDYVSGYQSDRGDLNDWITQKIEKNLKVEQGSWESRFIYITYTDSDARMAADVANAVTQAYIDQQHHMVTEPASQRAKRYTEELEALRDKMSAAQAAVANYWKQAGVDVSTSADDTTITELQRKLLDAQAARRLAEIRLKTGSSVSDTPLSADAVRLKGDLQTQQNQLAQLTGALGPKHPEIIALQAQIETTRRALDRASNSGSGGARSELNSARQLEAMLQQAVDQQKQNIIEGRDARSEGDRYQRDLDVAKQMYDKALQGYDQVLTASSGDYSNVSIVSQAKPPFQATKPKMLKNIALGFFAGCFLAFVIPMAKEFLNRKIRSREDFERDLGIPVVIELAPVSRRGAAA